MDKVYYKTLDPIIKSGHMQAAIDGYYKYPYKINLFPGTSCMYKCLFCGRDYDYIEKHSDYFYKEIIEEDINTDKTRFSISGGLEPLTYNYINTLCKDLYKNSYEPRILTNGYLLTENFLIKNEYLLAVNHIRVSLYGFNEEEYKQTTKSSKGFYQVKNNLQKFNKITSKPHLDINYVLLPQHFDNLEIIFKYIEDIGGIRKLSLREDHSFQYSFKDRNKLQDKLNEFNEEALRRNIKIDYGYALSQLLNGQKTTLISVTHKQLTPKQSPQIKIAIDPIGDIYSYMEAAFLNRKGSERHILGNIKNSSIEEELKKQKKIIPKTGDEKYLDAFNHVVEYYKWTKLQEIKK